MWHSNSGARGREACSASSRAPWSRSSRRSGSVGLVNRPRVGAVPACATRSGARTGTACPGRGRGRRAPAAHPGPPKRTGPPPPFCSQDSPGRGSYICRASAPGGGSRSRPKWGGRCSLKCVKGRRQAGRPATPGRPGKFRLQPCKPGTESTAPFNRTGTRPRDGDRGPSQPYSPGRPPPEIPD